ncbi:asparagine synthase C-terminal domain-containing protein [Myxococcus stipitatus]|uniref:asparagine synthase C-terminal domain-containing protein n=1 Tax=Myxococcus stipitatus TaxID=83455 RepID=UPI00314540F7
MSASSGDASSPLAILPSYQSPSGEPQESVWRLLPPPLRARATTPDEKSRAEPSETHGASSPLMGLEPLCTAAFLLHALPPHQSLFRGVDRVAPALPRVHREAAPAPSLSTEAQAQLHDEQARRLVAACSDVVGARVAAGARDVSLSGGVDSAVLCALAARHAPGRVRAWSMEVHFADETERRNARTVARLTGVDLVDVPIPDAVLPDLFEPTVIATETPLLNARVIASFAFYAAARLLGASVMLSGAGADEVLRGNPNAMAATAARIEEDRRLARAVLRPPVDNLGDTRDEMPWSLADAEATEEVRHAAWVLRELVLPPELRGARTHRLTVHTPYLDTRFADVALALPESSLSREGVGKWLFRQGVRGLVPDEVRLARKTPRYGHTALSSPMRARWLELYRAWLSPSRLEPLEVIDPKAALALLEHSTRMAPDAPEASAVDRLLMRLCSLAMLHAHAARGSSCPES